MTALTLYPNNVASSTVSTANKLLENPSTGATATNLNTNLTSGTTGWVELWSQGDASAQTGAGAQPSPTGHGWLEDTTLIEGNHFLSGNWVWTVELETTTTGTFTCDIHCRAYQRSSGGTYTLIAEGIATSQTVISTAYTQFTVTATGASASNTFATGDKLYTDVTLNITTNSTTGNMRVHMSSSATLGYANVSISTPGYVAVTTSTRTIPTSAVLQSTLTRTIPTSAVLSKNRTIPTSAVLSGPRTIPTSAVLMGTLTRTVPTSAVLTVTSSRTVPTSASLYNPGVFYASNVAQTIPSLILGDQLAPIVGGVETSVTVTMPASGTNTYVELTAQGGSPAATLALPSPTGLGWSTNVVDGFTFCAGSYWSNWTLAKSGTAMSGATLIVRLSRRTMDGTYYMIAIMTLTGQTFTTKTTYLLPTVSTNKPYQFVSGDTFYVDTFVYNGSTAWSSDVFTVYVSNSATLGVTNDGEIFTPQILQTSTGLTYLCGLPNFRIINGLPVSNQAFNLADALDQRSVLALTGEDTPGTTSTPRGTPVILSDSAQGLLYTGNVQSDDMSKVTVGSNPQIEHMHTDHDNHYWFDKNPNVTNYANWYAGDIVCDFLQKLAVEGVTGQYAIEADYTPTAFSQGTLSGTVATTTTSPFVYAPNTLVPPITTNTGDLELIRAGTQFMLTESITSDFSSGTLTNMVASNNELSPTTQSAIKVTAVFTSIATAQNVPATESGGIETSDELFIDLAYIQIWSGSMTVGSSDTFNFDVWFASTSPAFMGGMDLLFSDGTYLSQYGGSSTSPYGAKLDVNNSVGLFDQNGVNIDAFQDLSGYAKNCWYTRNIALTGLSGKTITGVYLYLAGSSAGTYTLYGKNCYLGSQSGSPFFGTSATVTQLNPPVTARRTFGGYLIPTIITSIVSVYDPLKSYRVSPAHSISSVGLVQSSTITWAASLPTSGASTQVTYPPGTQASTPSSGGTSPAMVLLVSYDGNTWLQCTNSQALPGLPPGSNVSGLSLYLREQFAAGPDPSAIPALIQTQITINSAAATTVSDTVVAYGGTTAWNTGSTQVLTGPDGNGNLTLGSASNPLTQNWSSSTILNQQTFQAGANNDGTQALSSGVYSIRTGAEPTGGAWCQCRFDWAGYFWNGTIEADLKLSSTNGNCGIMYRQTGWSNADNNFAYWANITNGGIQLSYGANNNANTSGSSNVLLAYIAETINANTFYHLKIVVQGIRHTIYFNHKSTPDIDILDNQYPNAGAIGFRTYTSGTSAVTGYIDNFSMVTTTVGTWTSAATALPSSTCGYNQISWTDLDSTGQPETTTMVLASVDNGSTWRQCTNGAEIPQLPRGTNTTGMHLILQMILSSATPPVSTPVIMGLYTRICGSYGTVTGTRISPVLNLSPVTYLSSSNVMYNSNTPTGTSIAVSTSINAGSSWEAVANSGAGATLPYWTNQPSPTQDLFSTNTLANYTNTSRTGGSPASVLYTTAQSQLSLSGGSSGLYLSNAPASVGDIEVACCMSQSDSGGLVWHYTNGSNFYELVVFDASSSGGSTNSLQLYKISSNVRTLLGTASIVFTRGTFHIVKAVMEGGLINAYWDGQCVLSYLDTSPLASGLAGLRNSGGVSLYYQIWIQPLGTNLSGVGLQTKVVLSTSDPQYMPQLFVLSCAVRGPHIAQGSQIYQLHPLTMPFASYYSTEMDQLAQADGDSYWYVDRYGECFFMSRYARLGAFPLQTAHDPANASGELLYVPTVKVTTSSDTFRNQQIITNVTTLITPPIEFKVSDGTSTSWQLGYPVYSAPIITFTNGQAATVGVQGIDNNRQFYWQPNSPTISYDSSLPVLPTGTVFSVQYVGQSINNLIVNNSSSQTTQAALEGNSGIVAEIETALRSTTIGMTTAQATTFANGLLNRNGISNAVEVSGTIMYAGLKPGTFIPVFLPEFNIWNVQLPIVKATTTALPAATGLPVYQWAIQATNGSNQSQWQRVFGIL